MSQFQIGLKDDVRDLFLIVPKVYTLNEFIAQVVACDNRLFERRQEKQYRWYNKPTMLKTTNDHIQG